MEINFSCTYFKQPVANIESLTIHILFFEQDDENKYFCYQFFFIFL